MWSMNQRYGSAVILFCGLKYICDGCGDISCIGNLGAYRRLSSSRLYMQMSTNPTSPRSAGMPKQSGNIMANLWLPELPVSLAFSPSSLMISPPSSLRISTGVIDWQASPLHANPARHSHVPSGKLRPVDATSVVQLVPAILSTNNSNNSVMNTAFPKLILLSRILRDVI